LSFQSGVTTSERVGIGCIVVKDEVTSEYREPSSRVSEGRDNEGVFDWLIATNGDNLSLIEGNLLSEDYMEYLAVIGKEVK